MRVALLSDIHANFEALTAVSDVLASADQVICLGDYVGYYCQVNEVCEFVRGMNAICILGNHDAFLLNGCPDSLPESVRFGIEYADRALSAEHRQWLRSLPLVWAGVLDGRSILAVHGSPWDPLGDYLYADSESLPRLDEFAYDVIAFGQTHYRLKRLDHKPCLLNPGSVGQSRDLKAQACMALLETATMAVEAVERPYEARAVIDLALEHGAPAAVEKHLV
jgi:putative phosphoesterase